MKYGKHSWRKIRLLLMLLILAVGIRCEAKAAEVRVLCINGGGADANDKSYLYSASIFAKSLKGTYVNDMEVKSYTFADNPGYDRIDTLISNTFGSASSGDLSIFYYSGHGGRNPETKAAGIVASDEYLYTHTRLYQKLAAIPGKKLVILDCCYSGAFITQNSIDKSRFTVLTACTEDSFSPFYNKMSLISKIAGEKVMLTYFSDALFNGLGFYDGQSAKADSDSDLAVSFSELFSYLQKNYQKKVP